MKFLLFLSFIIATLTVVWGLNGLESAVTGEGDIIFEDCQPSYLGQFPYHLGIRFVTSGGVLICSAILIAPNWAITAAHCAAGATEAFIYAGTITVDPDDSKRVPVRREDIYVHPKYNSQTHEDDIALVYVRIEITSNDHIAPAIVRRTELVDDCALYRTFWVPNDYGIFHQYNSVIPAARQIVCGTANVFFDNVNCFNLNFLLGKCLGDPSYIVTCREGATYYARGIFSFSPVTGVAVHTKIPPYYDWIQATIGFAL